MRPHWVKRYPYLPLEAADPPDARDPAQALQRADEDVFDEPGKLIGLFPGALRIGNPGNALDNRIVDAGRQIDTMHVTASSISLSERSVF